MQTTTLPDSANFVPVNVARHCQRAYDNLRPFVSGLQRKKAWTAFQELDLATLQALERELDLI